MLSTVEKILYILLAMTSLGLASVAFSQMVRVILRGQAFRCTIRSTSG